MSQSKIKKILLISLFIVVIILVSILLYKIFTANRKEKTIVPPSLENTGSLPNIKEGKIAIINNEKIYNKQSNNTKIISKQNIDKVAKGSFTDSKEILSKNVKSLKFSKVNKAMVYYDDNNELFYRVDGDGKIFRLSDHKFHSVINVVWSSAKNQAIIEYPEDDNVAYNKILYDFDQDRSLTSFQKEMKEFNFSYTGNRLSAKWIGDYDDYNYVVSVDANGNNFKFVEPMAEKSKDVQIVWSPDGEVLATYRKTIDGARQEVFFINGNGKNLKSLVVDGRGFKGFWNPKGDKIVYSVFNEKSDYSPRLWIANGESDKLGSGKAYTGLNTWVDKCDFSQKNNEIVYCAVPDYLPTGSAWFPELADKIPYHIYKINTNTGRKEKIADPVVNGKRVTIDKIYLSNDDQKIFYKNKANGHLYSIDLIN